jgi:hypothetical protein
MLQNELKRKGGAENKRDKNHRVVEESKTCVKLDSIIYIIILNIIYER